MKFLDYPHSTAEERIEVEKLPHDFYRVTVRYGFKDEPDLPRDLATCKDEGLKIDTMDSSFFIGKENLILVENAEMPYWRKKIFSSLFRSAETITNQFKLPPNRVIELGAQVTF